MNALCNKKPPAPRVNFRTNRQDQKLLELTLTGRYSGRAMAEAVGYSLNQVHYRRGLLRKKMGVSTRSIRSGKPLTLGTQRRLDFSPGVGLALSLDRMIAEVRQMRSRHGW